MDQAILHEVIRLPPEFYDLSVKLLPVGERGEVKAGAKEEGEGVVVGRAARGEHLPVQGESFEWLVPIDVGSHHGVPEEGGAVGEAVKEEAGVGEVAAGGES